MRRVYLVLLAAFVICVPGVRSYAEAQVCAQGYERSDREMVKEQFPLIETVLNRMAGLAEMSASSTVPVASRLGWENQFKDLQHYLASYGDLRLWGASLRASRFMSTVVSPSYLGLSKLTLRGSTVAKSQENSRKALDALNSAIDTAHSCLWLSWDHHEISGTPDDNQCAGGFDKADEARILKIYMEAITTLERMSQISVTVGWSVLSTSQRALYESDFVFEREGLDILGETAVSGVSARTQNFVSKIVNPIFLGLNTATVTGSTIAQAQQNAQDAWGSVNKGKMTLESCWFYSVK